MVPITYDASQACSSPVDHLLKEGQPRRSRDGVPSLGGRWHEEVVYSEALPEVSVSVGTPSKCRRKEETVESGGFLSLVHGASVPSTSIVDSCSPTKATDQQRRSPTHMCKMPPPIECRESILCPWRTGGHSPRGANGETSKVIDLGLWLKPRPTWICNLARKSNGSFATIFSPDLHDAKAQRSSKEDKHRPRNLIAGLHKLAFSLKPSLNLSAVVRRCPLCYEVWRQVLSRPRRVCRSVDAPILARYTSYTNCTRKAF